MRYVLLLLVLAGCASQEQIERRQQQEELRAEQNERIYLRALTNRCNQFGFQTGTQDHSNCMMRLHQQNRANMGAANAAAIQGYAAEEAARRERDCRQYGRAMPHLCR